MKIAEIFHSIQGEGILSGVPSTFIRTSGCNLRCSWCDTPYTSWQPEGEQMSVESILAEVDRGALRHVVVTGGEPMIAPGIAELCQQLRNRGLHITIETAGTVLQSLPCDLMSISPKLANSTPTGPFAAQHERLRINTAVLQRLMQMSEYQLKFVVQGEADLAEIAALEDQLAAPRDRILLMPEGISAEQLQARSVWLADVCRREGYRFSHRLHVLIWGHRRGV
jgi:7-carboxy-7-deazaguanine synthase